VSSILRELITRNEAFADLLEISRRSVE